ncbi:integrase family protein [Rhizobium etli 8C-3]|uniref:Integrase family protein n=1 Tax=Rhizobium etli 8C-3 TaxID=538025 RepID=A0A1L5P250_RHIET|nr:site-specific integrase [Rhizobium etli]APO74230.1 integrase family protein [Rhizobium etli 8C-3]
MSVYKRPGKETYSYDFIVGGRRFSGDTRATKKRDAKAFEDTERELAKAQLSVEQAFSSSTMTFEVAALRWYNEVGQHHKNFETTLKNLEWLKLNVGASTDLRDISDEKVAAIVAKRRGERVRRLGKKGKVHLGALVGPATVNRTCTQPLREIILRAKNVWKVTVGDVDFGKHILKEPKERVREASLGEEDAIMGELERGYDDAVRFAFLNGCRRMEILGLEWSRVDFFSRRFTVIGKGNKERTLPMSQETFDLLWAQKDFHPIKVFTFVAKKTMKKVGYVRDQRYPLTESGLKSAMRRAVPRAGVTNFRFHDTRHTAATRVLRASNLRVAQKLLGHADVATTAKYAHALDDDLRNALEATSSPTKSPTTDSSMSSKELKSGGNSD